MALTGRTAKWMFSVSQFPQPPVNRTLGRSVNSAYSTSPSVGLLFHNKTPYIHTSTLYKTHCYDLHHHCYLILDLRAIPRVASRYGFLGWSILTVRLTQATLIILRKLICRGSNIFTSAEGGLRRNYFPKITVHGIENGHFYRKRASQRSSSKPK